MESLEPNPILEFNPNQLVEVRKTFGYDDLSRLHQDLKIFQDWIQLQHHFVVKDYEKDYLERYLISSKGSIERAKTRLDKLCTLRGLMPEYLQGFDVKNDFQNLRKLSNVGVLPKPTPDNYRVFFYVFYNSDPSIFEHIDLARYMIMIFHYMFYHDYNAGVELIFDTTKMTLGVISKISPMVVANAMLIIVEGMGLRVKGLHFFSGSKFIDTVVSIVKQGLSKKLISRFHIHENYEALFKHIPKSILPKDLGGDYSTSREICDKIFKELLKPEFLTKLKYMEGATTNESKRLRSKFNEQYSGMPGSFKVLSVD